MALVRTDVSEERSASFIRVTRIGEMGTTLTVTNNRRTLRRNVTVPDLKDLLFLLMSPCILAGDSHSLVGICILHLQGIRELEYFFETSVSTDQAT
jgi:hypothetical protein